MAQSTNLPVVQEELVDGGLQVNSTEILGDAIYAIGFAEAGNVAADQYAFTPILMKRGDFATYVYGHSYPSIPASGIVASGSTVTKAVYELADGGGNNVYAFSLGQWGSATFTDYRDGNVYPLFSGNDVIKENYYKCLDNVYELVKMAPTPPDILYPVDAKAFDTVTVVANRPTNFAWQLARACYDISSQNSDCTGLISVGENPDASLRGIQSWVGTLPTYDLISGAVLVNGTGLLGQQFMSGAVGSPGAAISPGFYMSNFTSDDIAYGYPPLNDSEVLKDRMGNYVDIGTYISITAFEVIDNNASNDSNYSLNGAPIYAGLTSVLDPQNAPTGKTMPAIVGLRYGYSLAQLDKLTGARYVTARKTNRGIVVTDAPTAGRPGSDYNRLQVRRIVNAVMKLTRQICDPYIGQANSAEMQAALKTALQTQYQSFVSKGALQKFDFTISASDTERVLGKLSIYLTLVPEFELRTINVIVNLKSNL
jgi:hypothetical protein